MEEEENNSSHFFYNTKLCPSNSKENLEPIIPIAKLSLKKCGRKLKKV